MVMTPMKTADDTERMLGTVMSLKGQRGGPVAGVPDPNTREHASFSSPPVQWPQPDQAKSLQ